MMLALLLIAAVSSEPAELHYSEPPQLVWKEPQQVELTPADIEYQQEAVQPLYEDASWPDQAIPVEEPRRAGMSGSAVGDSRESPAASACASGSCSPRASRGFLRRVFRRR